MSIMDNLKAKAVDIIDPRLRPAVEKLMARNEYLESHFKNTPLGRQEAAEQLYSNTNTGMRPGTWAVRVSETLNILGFLYLCKCGTEYAFPDSFEAMKDHKCNLKSCGEKMELLKYVGIDNETPHNQYQSIFLSKLPHRPFSVDKPKQSPFQQVGDWTVNDAALDESNWSGDENKARSRAFANNDPGFGGLF